MTNVTMKRAGVAGVLLVFVIGAPVTLAAQATSVKKEIMEAPVDGPGHRMMDSLLDRLIGTWTVTRRVHGRTTTVVAEAEYVLNHQFVRLHYHADSTATPYEAIVFIGYDNTRRRYVAHWLDVGGGRWSETLGFGVPVPAGIRLDFVYPEGPFENTLTFDATTGGRQSVMRQKNRGAPWSSFGDEHFRKACPLQVDTGK